MSFRYQLVLLIVASLMAAEAPAGMMDMFASKDNSLYEESGELSNGAGNFLFTGQTASINNFYNRRALLAFDIVNNGIPAGSRIDAVTLTLRLSKAASPTPQDVSLHRVTTNWGEGTSDAPVQEGGGTTATPGDATWTHAFWPGDVWSVAGGDFDPVASATTSVASTFASYTWSSPQMVADLQGWLDDPSTDFGWILIGNEASGSTARRFNSRENGVNPPVLSVTFTTDPSGGPTVPEPSAFVLLGLIAGGTASVLSIRQLRRQV